jgi:Uma2 family endonuclease
LTGGGKFQRYRTIPSLREYVTAAQDQVLIEQFVRQEDGSELRVYRQPDAIASRNIHAYERGKL